MNETEPLWPMPWIRASLDLAILSTLLSEPLHGYAIAVKLQEIGMGRLKGGSLYPSLARLEQDGLVEAVWQPGESGPGRKAYALTSRGREEQHRLLVDWNGLCRTLNRLGTEDKEN